MRKTGFILFLSIILIMASCASADYTPFRESRPLSILVMPPINKTSEANASASFLVSSAQILSRGGYYVIPVTLSTQTFTQIGITNGEDAHKLPHARLRELFNADAALYITINNYSSTLGTIMVSASATLVDLKTGQELWTGKGQASEAASSGGGGILGFALSVTETQAENTATNRIHSVASTANSYMLNIGSSSGIPYGPYHSWYPME